MCVCGGGGGGGGKRELKNLNLKTLFYKDCSLGSVKNSLGERERVCVGGGGGGE